MFFRWFLRRAVVDDIRNDVYFYEKHMAFVEAGLSDALFVYFSYRAPVPHIFKF